MASLCQDNESCATQCLANTRAHAQTSAHAWCPHVTRCRSTCCWMGPSVLPLLSCDLWSVWTAWPTRPVRTEELGNTESGLRKRGTAQLQRLDQKCVPQHKWTFVWPVTCHTWAYLSQMLHAPFPSQPVDLPAFLTYALHPFTFTVLPVASCKTARYLSLCFNFRLSAMFILLIYAKKRTLVTILSLFVLIYLSYFEQKKPHLDYLFNWKREQLFSHGQ